MSHPVGTKVLYEFKLAEVMELNEDGFVKRVRYGPVECSGRNLTVFPNTKENAAVAKEFEDFYDGIYKLPNSRGLNWPVIYSVVVSWFEHVLTGMMTIDDARKKLEVLQSEIQDITQAKSGLGFNLLR